MADTQAIEGRLLLVAGIILFAPEKRAGAMAGL
jgi:hypothetical protein